MRVTIIAAALLFALPAAAQTDRAYWQGYSQGSNDAAMIDDLYAARQQAEDRYLRRQSIEQWQSPEREFCSGNPDSPLCR